MWPFKRGVQKRSVSIGDPLVAMMLGYSSPDGVTVSESTAMTLSAVWRSVNIVAGSVASLPMRTLESDKEGRTVKVSSFLDEPGGEYYTPFEWKELATIYLILRGDAFLQHIFNAAGAVKWLNPIHPSCVEVEWDDKSYGGRKFTTRDENGRKQTFDARNMTHIMGPSLDGLRGLSVISLARLSLGTGIAGDRAANRQFTNGAMISGLVTPRDDESLGEGEAEIIADSIKKTMTGAENAGRIPVINRKLQFTPWTLSAEDAQFIQSRTFSIDEVGRWFGVPPHLLGLTEKATSWGQGIAEQNRGLARYTLNNTTGRMEGRLSRLVPPNRKIEFDYSAFVKPSPEDEIDLLISQVNNGLLTLNEARAIRNLGPLPGGDIPRAPAGAQNPALEAPAPQPAPETEPQEEV